MYLLFPASYLLKYNAARIYEIIVDITLMIANSIHVIVIRPISFNNMKQANTAANINNDSKIIYAPYYILETISITVKRL